MNYLRRIMTQPAASRNFGLSANPLILSSSAFIRPTSAPLQYSLARFLSENLKSKLDEVVKKNDIVVFMKGTLEQPMCGFSRAAVQIFAAQGVDQTNIKTFNVLEDEELRAGIKEYSSWPTIPQVYIKGEFIGGTDVLLSMHQSGDLEELLIKEALIPAEPDSDSQ